MSRSVAAVILVNALLIVAPDGITYLLLVVAAYVAGTRMVSRLDVALVVGAGLGGLAAQLVGTGHAIVGHLVQAIVGHVVFMALPLLVGRYLAQHRRLVSALADHNRYLRRERQLLAEQEQLRERLRIARDVHDSLGHRLTLVAVQAAALETTTPAAGAVADAARGAVAELYQLVGSLRGLAEDTPGAAGIGALAERFRTTGVAVTLTEQGEARPLPPAVDAAAFRLVEEGLTNAMKHAPGRPVALRVDWEADTLVVTVTNPLGTGSGGGAGTGLTGLRERVERADGFLDHRVADGQFRLVALLPTGQPAEEQPARKLSRVRVAAIGTAAAAIIFAVLPLSAVAGIG